MSDTNLGASFVYDTPEDREIARLDNKLVAARRRIAELESELAAAQAAIDEPTVLLNGAKRVITRQEHRIAELEPDSERYRWLRDRVTYYDVDADYDIEGHNVPTLAQVSNRIWYHATDDTTNNTIDAAIDAAREKETNNAP